MRPGNGGGCEEERGHFEDINCYFIFFSFLFIYFIIITINYEIFKILNYYNFDYLILLF